MFHKFSAAPASKQEFKVYSLVQASNEDQSRRKSDVSPSKGSRAKTARACDRCRIQRVRCNEQRPCKQCAEVEANCTTRQRTKQSPDHAKRVRWSVSPSPQTVPSGVAKGCTPDQTAGYASQSQSSRVVAATERQWPFQTKSFPTSSPILLYLRENTALCAQSYHSSRIRYICKSSGTRVIPPFR